MVEAAMKRLDDLVKRKPELGEAAAFYRAIIPLLRQAQAAVPPFVLDPALAQQKIDAGRPLLVGEELPLDGEATADLFVGLCQVVENSPAGQSRAGWSLFKRGSAGGGEPAANGKEAALRSAAARQIRQAVAAGRLDLEEVWAAVAGGGEQQLEVVASHLQLDPGLLRVLAENSLKPAFRAWAENLQPVVDLSHWLRFGRGCPMCGNSPTLSEIQGKEGERRLRCGRCGAGWYYPRFQCAFCHTQGHKTLGYLAIEGEEEKYRLQTCDVCRGYLKMVVTYDPIPVELLAVEDLATLHLDGVAREHGFTHTPHYSPANGSS
jgi:FdhE protein